MKFSYKHLILLACCLAGMCAEAIASKKPNFVFFLSDDQLKADYGCYGLPLDLTPITDQLAKEGLVFDQMFTTQAICAPSRSSLFTGQYPIRNGCFINHIGVRQGTKTVYDALKPLGYEIALAGKVHVQPRSVFRWDTYIAYGSSKDLPLDKIDQYLESARNKRFCLFITSNFPHGPYPRTPQFPADRTIRHPHIKSSSNKALAGYYDHIAKKEKELERVLAMLKKHGLESNTVFCYSADHGNGADAKYSVYDRGLNVPFIVRWPGKIKPARTDALVSYVDILPTFVEIAGGKLPKNVDGKSFYPLLKGQAQQHHQTVFGLMTQQGVLATHVFPRRSARGKRYHYIRNFNTLERIRRDERAGKKIDPFHRLGAAKHPDTPEEELYDAKTDPFELVNLAQDPRYAKIKAQLKQEMFSWMKQQNDFLTIDGKIPYLKSKHPVDQSGEKYTCPPELAGTVKEYLDPHELTGQE